MGILVSYACKDNYVYGMKRLHRYDIKITISIKVTYSWLS